MRVGLGNFVSGREHVRPTSWPNSIPRPRTDSIDWPNLRKCTPTKGVARRIHEVLWRNTDAQYILFRLPVHDLHEKLHWVRGAVAKYAILLLFYCFCNIMSSACLRSHFVPAYSCFFAWCIRCLHSTEKQDTRPSRWSPKLRLQVSDCTSYRRKCDFLSRYSWLLQGKYWTFSKF